MVGSILVPFICIPAMGAARKASRQLQHTCGLNESYQVDGLCCKDGALARTLPASLGEQIQNRF
jgi:hypothetical protein